MPYTILPPGFKAIFLGSAAAMEDLGAFAPLEQNSEEGALFLARLDFAEFPSEEALTQLETALQEAAAGIPVPDKRILDGIWSWLVKNVSLIEKIGRERLALINRFQHGDGAAVSPLAPAEQDRPQ